MHNYNLGFIEDDIIFKYVKDTVSKYSTAINLEKFNSNVIDPIKLTFDAKVYGKTIQQVIEDECLRQIDKANSNQLGYFHQNLFNLVGNGWRVPDEGFDIVNDERKVYVEMKNKHNTMNAASQRDTYLSMLNVVANDKEATCMLVEVIAKQSQYKRWEGTFKGHYYTHPNILRLSIDKFYGVVFNDSTAFARLCRALPTILDDVIEETGQGNIDNTVMRELSRYSMNIFKSLYLLAFRTYDGFNFF